MKRLAILFALALAACSGGSGSVAPPAPVSIQPSALTMSPGQSATLTVSGGKTPYRVRTLQCTNPTAVALVMSGADPSHIAVSATAADSCTGSVIDSTGASGGFSITVQ